MGGPNVYSCSPTVSMACIGRAFLRGARSAYECGTASVATPTAAMGLSASLLCHTAMRFRLFASFFAPRVQSPETRRPVRLRLYPARLWI